MGEDNEDKLTTGQVADHLGISERELQNLLRNRIIRQPKPVPGKFRRLWSEEDVDEAREAYVKYAKGQKRKRAKEV